MPRDDDVPRVEITDYIGLMFPADLWGAAPIRGRAVQVLDTYLAAHSDTGETWCAGDLVDELIKAGLLPDETHHNG